ncbi:Crp/Fnr family transcriptional regulator [Pedobacter yulinensis]|uniref:Crp/Fnr family transcriptional regulator n=1 Tax=Pedobacter yulinensis TaxID=2126353 RepID=A0A2T3HHG3_9SPHI|nr:Crp/Fnr family transcriptional regulator [Pedobacter yulinensis]PST81821.1 Crp/Fnr family transcriptional regulator [Pedobacter yulinensis]
MLRTNPSLLRYIDGLYAGQSKSDHIMLKAYSAGELLLAQGSTASKVLVLKSGICKCFFTEENGKDYILEFMGEGEIFGEIEAIRNTSCLCNVAAVTTASVYQLSLPAFHTLLHDEPEFSKLVLGELAERLVNTSSRASFQQLYTVKHGLARLRDLQRRQNITLQKEDVAAYLGITLRSLNRLLKDDAPAD